MYFVVVNEKDFEGLVWGTYSLLLENVVMKVNEKREKTYYLPVEVKNVICENFALIDVLCERNENFKKINQDIVDQLKSANIPWKIKEPA